MPTFLNSGAFADVFDMGDGYVAKVFRRKPCTHEPVIDWEDHDWIVRMVCNVELAAYAKVALDPEIADHFPRCHGIISAIDVPPAARGPRYVAGCAFRIERVNGHDQKVGLLRPPLRPRADLVLARVKELCPRIETVDASCFVPGPRAAFSLIDFALWRDMGDAQMILGQTGKVPTELRRRLCIVSGVPDV